MNIAALPSTMSAMRAPEAMEGPGPDHDGDADDAGAVTQPGATALPPKGMGTVVDKTA